LKKIIIFAAVTIFWVIISIALAVFAGIGIFMLFMLLSSIAFAFLLGNPSILEWARGEKYTQEQRNQILSITSSKKHRLIFMVNFIIFLILTLVLLFHNYRLIDLIGK
jgi:hypothetical protein